MAFMVNGRQSIKFVAGVHVTFFSPMIPHWLIMAGDFSFHSSYESEYTNYYGSDR